MNELAVQAANGTNSESDRSSIQDEINQLTTEIDRVAETTKFNETYLLKGDNGTKEIKIAAHDAGLLGTFSQNTIKATFTMNELKVGDTYTIGGTQYEIGGKTAKEVLDAIGLDNASKAIVGTTIQIAGKSWTFVDNTTGTTDEELFTIKYDDLASKISEGTKAEYNGKSATRFSVATSSLVENADPNNKTLLTATGAYVRVKTELIAASSIGATKTPASIADADDKAVADG
jgi:flagellin